MWNRSVPIVASSLRYFGRRRSAEDGINEFVSNLAADPIGNGNSTSEDYCPRDADEKSLETENQYKPKSATDIPKWETVNWNSVKDDGLCDLNTTQIHFVRKELLSHVPSETVVMKYGYVRFTICFHL